MFSKIFSLSQRAVKIAVFMSLIADTIKYFSEQSISRGLHSDAVQTDVKPVEVKNEAE